MTFSRQQKNSTRFKYENYLFFFSVVFNSVARDLQNLPSSKKESQRDVHSILPVFFSPVFIFVQAFCLTQCKKYPCVFATSFSFFVVFSYQTAGEHNTKSTTHGGIPSTDHSPTDPTIEVGKLLEGEVDELPDLTKVGPQ